MSIFEKLFWNFGEFIKSPIGLGLIFLAILVALAMRAIFTTLQKKSYRKARKVVSNKNMRALFEEIISLLKEEANKNPRSRFDVKGQWDDFHSRIEITALHRATDKNTAFPFAKVSVFPGEKKPIAITYPDGTTSLTDSFKSPGMLALYEALRNYDFVQSIR